MRLDSLISAEPGYDTNNLHRKLIVPMVLRVRTVRNVVGNDNKISTATSQANNCGSNSECSNSALNSVSISGSCVVSTTQI